jgi:hypothetical protein
VRTSDEEKAREIDRVHWLQGAPDHAATFKYEDQNLNGTCPACSAAIPEGSADCPECGLVVNPGAEVVLCPECDAEVGPDVDRCPNCGVEFE